MKPWFLSLVALPCLAAHPLALPAPDAAPAAAVEPLPVVPTLEARFGQLGEALPAIESLDALAKRLGTAEAAFAFVRDKIALQAYPGSLRGAEGCLRAAAGNSLDRAALLLELLRRQERPARLARAMVTEEQAAAWLQRLTAEPVLLPGASPLVEAIGRRAAAAHVPLRDVALAPLSETLELEALRAAALTDLLDHWWVEHEGDNGWQALDPTLREARAGVAVGEAEETFEEIPEDRQQMLVFRVVAEIAEGDFLHREVALEHRVSAVEAASSDVELGRGAEGQGAGLAGVLGSALGVSGYTPALRFGGQMIPGSAVVFGEAAAKPAGGGGLGGALNALSFGEDKPAAEAAQRELAGLVLEIESEAPGVEPLRQRRLLFDRLPAAARLAWEAAGHPEETKVKLRPVQAGEVAAALGASHLVHTYHGAHDPGAWAAMTENLLIELLAEHQEKGGDEAVATGSLQDLQASVWRSLAILADLFVTPAVNDLKGLRFYPARPRLAVVSTFLPADVPGYGLAVDLLQDELRVVPDAGVPAAAVAERQLWRAALSGALEAELGGLFTRDFLPKWSDSDDSATRLRELRLLRAGAAPAKAGIALRGALASGALVAATAEDRPETFWEIRPTDGHARALLEPGLGGMRKIFKLHGVASYGNGVVQLDASYLKYLCSDTADYYEIMDRNLKRMQRTRPAPRGRAGGVAGEYVEIQQTILNSVPLSIAFTLETGGCMALGIVAIVDGLKGRDWTDRLR